MFDNPFVEDALEHGPVPLYYQLEKHLRSRIAADEFAPGVPLPTEDQICKEYKVSRITVRRALEGLQRQGLIERRRGLGSFVLENRLGINSQLTGSLTEFLAKAGSLHTANLGLTEAAPSSAIRKQLELGPHESATLLRTIGLLDDMPVAYYEIWLPLDIGSKLPGEELDGHMPVIRLVERVAKARVTRAEQTIEPGHAGEEAATHLHIDAKTPILHVQRTYFAGDRPIELANVRYHPDRYRYAIELKG
ncbi:GntR family transcriptional regulator [Sphingobium sp. JS3065]|uniref:GntR family transcriptional regulator n=1 Tax=Sphingobium sp. JS3065 TaxID=2970925 RepID=UPI0022641DCC|nr:GntR family transcriptional regulator [Sphingobium sp. JS3065]UZW57409.1 GntR family transcriptional regulator [Sphingobium sp. JS3065]